METAESIKVTLIGAGLAGSAMAVLLGKAGYKVDVYEHRGDLRTIPAAPGRSINLALSTRGITALQEAGLADEVLADAVPMRGRMVHGADGSLSYQPYSKDPNLFINSVSRRRLNMAMLDAAHRCPGVTLHFNEKCLGVDLEHGEARLRNMLNLKKSRVGEGGVIIGADGAFSRVRASMQRRDRFDYQQVYLEHGYKELNIPPGPDGRHAMEKHALHIWPRRSYMMIALPNQDGSFTCTLFWPLEGPVSFGALKTPADIRRFFNEHFPDAVPLMPTLVEDYQRNPTSSLVTVRCHPWYVENRVALIGDAAHAVVPFYGQGINAGFEDCIVLMDCIKRYAPDWRRAFEHYYRQRKENTDALSELAIENFLEMRDHVGSPAFLRKKKFERWLDRYFPGYVPMYSMVTFSRIPYAEAVRRAARQDRLVRRVMWGVAAGLTAVLAGIGLYMVL